MDRAVALQTCTDAGTAPPGRPASTERGPEPDRSGPSQPGRLRGLVLLARLELVRVLQVVERASTAPGVQRTGEVAVSVAVAVWDEDPGYPGGEAGAASTR
jgi:hypothetical protein